MDQNTTSPPGAPEHSIKSKDAAGIYKLDASKPVLVSGLMQNNVLNISDLIQVYDSLKSPQTKSSH